MPSLFRLAISYIASLVIGPYYDSFTAFLASPSFSYPNAIPKPYCAHVSQIGKAEYDTRQSALVANLLSLGASAYITEPSANSQFFANFSSANWKLSERPLLLIIRPVAGGDQEQSLPQVTLLTPKFERLRATTLPVVSFNETSIQYLEWAEDANPYAVAISGIGFSPDSAEIIFVDSSIRKFIVDGLQQAAPHARIASAPTEITSLRERKSPAELKILKCANEATVLAIRKVQNQMYIGMRESQARDMLSSALSEVGLKNGGCLTLFGANAALPHGTGSDRVLEASDLALFDCGGSLHGYQSDVTRTVALPDSHIPDDHLRIWHAVRKAQYFALDAAKAGVLTKGPDEAARNLLKTMGLDEYFTHRLGHGIGLEGHEQPYLRGKSEDLIKSGHTFSNEPGLYIEGKVGVRLEDCFYIDDKGNGVYLTEGVGGPSLSPWAP